MFCRFYVLFSAFIATSIDLKLLPVLAKIDSSPTVFKPDLKARSYKLKSENNGDPVGPRPISQLKMSFIRQTHDGKWDVGIPISLWQRFTLKHPTFSLPVLKHVTGGRYVPKQTSVRGPEESPQVSWEYMNIKNTQTAVIPSVPKDSIFLQYWGPNSAILPSPSTMDTKAWTPALPMSEDGFWHTVFESEKDAADFIQLVTGAGQPIPEMPNTDAADITRHPPKLTKTSDEVINGGIVSDELFRAQGQQTTEPTLATQPAEYAADTPEFVSTR